MSPVTRSSKAASLRSAPDSPSSASHFASDADSSLDVDFTAIYTAAVCLAVLQAVSGAAVDRLGLAWDEGKGLYGRDFASFYPFYVSQHQDPTCVCLHVVATGVLVLLCAHDYRIALSLGLGALGGLSMKEWTRSLSSGLLEMLVMQGIYLCSMVHMKASVKKALAVPLVCYGFAWVGHFFFEENKPATFIYPVYSLLGDFRLFAGQVFKFYGNN